MTKSAIGTLLTIIWSAVGSLAAQEPEGLGMTLSFGYATIDGIDTDLVSPGLTLEGGLRYDIGFIQVEGGVRFSRHAFRNSGHVYDTFMPFFELRRRIVIGSPEWLPFVVGRVGLAREGMAEPGVTFRAGGPSLGASIGMRYQADAAVGLELGVSYDYLAFGDYEVDAAHHWRKCIDVESGERMTPLIRAVDTCSPRSMPPMGERGFTTFPGTARSVQEFRIFLGVTVRFI